VRTIPLLLLIVVFSGCQAPQQTFHTPDARWHTETGQLQYSNPKRSIIGETVVTALDHQEFQLDFMAGPGFPIMKLRRSSDMAHAESALAHVSWNGKTEHPPGKLKPWLALADVFWRLSDSNASQIQVILQSSQAGFWKATANLKLGRPADVTIEFPQSQERFIFHLNQ